MKRILSLIILLLLTATMMLADVRQLPSAHKKEYYADGFFVSASNFDYSPIAREVVGNAGKHERLCVRDTANCSSGWARRWG